jgi:hypothetical protein
LNRFLGKVPLAPAALKFLAKKQQWMLFLAINWTFSICRGQVTAWLT